MLAQIGSRIIGTLRGTRTPATSGRMSSASRRRSLRGIREAQCSLLVFGHDDTVLAPDYLEQALRIEAEWPILGAWGGDVAGEFEITTRALDASVLGTYRCARLQACLLVQQS